MNEKEGDCLRTIRNKLGYPTYNRYFIRQQVRSLARLRYRYSQEDKVHRYAVPLDQR